MPNAHLLSNARRKKNRIFFPLVLLPQNVGSRIRYGVHEAPPHSLSSVAATS